MHDVAYGHFGDLAADCTGNVCNLYDYLRHVVRAGVLAHLLPDALSQAIVECQALAQTDEQDNAHIPFVCIHDLLADHEAFNDLGKLLHLPVDLRRPDSDSTRIERRVAAASDDHAAMFRKLGPVTVAPYAGIMVEVGRAILRPVSIIPERDWHAWKRLFANEFARLTAH